MKHTYKDPSIRIIVHGFLKSAIDNGAQTVTLQIGDAKKLVDWFVEGEQELREMLKDVQTADHRCNVFVKEFLEEILGVEAS